VRAYRRQTLTPAGVASAVVVASLYTVHPWGALLLLLFTFYLTGTFFTKVRRQFDELTFSINTTSKTIS
jgi:uncharacterized membrane protein